MMTYDYYQIRNDSLTQAVFKRLRILNDLLPEQPIHFHVDTTVGGHVGVYNQSAYINSLGHHSFIHGAVMEPITVGNYTSIAEQLLIFGLEHPYTSLSTSPAIYSSEIKTSSFIPMIFPEHQDLPAPSIGNDVWIGRQAMLKRGISLADGCIVGAGAVVTKDVPAYAVVAGNPAKIIKYRFPPEIISQLIDLNWHQYCVNSFQGVDFNQPIQEQIDRLRSLKLAGKLKRLDAPELLSDTLTALGVPMTLVEL
jgi:acetyltransferase-like isoleucine patch superfamily enzyme